MNCLIWSLLGCLSLITSQGSVITLSWSWPPLPQNPLWDFVYVPYENESYWNSTIEPTITNDLLQMLNTLNISNNDLNKRHAISFEINVPAMVISVERNIAIVQRFCELALKLDLPLTYKFVGYVWWDYDLTDCPPPQCYHIWYCYINFVSIFLFFFYLFLRKFATKKTKTTHTNLKGIHWKIRRHGMKQLNGGGGQMNMFGHLI